MKLCSYSFISLAIIFALSSANGQGTVIIQHVGSTDPTTEGFELTSIGTHAFVGPVTGTGISAWNTTVSNVNNNISYTYLLTSQQQAETIGTDWVLSFTMQDLLPNSLGNNFVIVGGAFTIYVGSETNGDPFVGLSPKFVLNGGGSGYHNYQVNYDAATATASLWLDGTEQISNYLTNISIPNGINEIIWGESQAGPSSANWSLVSLQIVPEPGGLALLMLGGGVLVYVIRRRHR